MEEKYNVIDLRTDLQEIVQETIDFSYEQCLNWIEANGGIVIFTIRKQ